MADDFKDDSANTSESTYSRPWLQPYHWKPGQSGNPHGRPKRKPITDAIIDLLDTPLPGDKQGRTMAEGIAFALIKEALKGKVNAIAEAADRVEGKLSFLDKGDSGDRLDELVQAIRSGAVARGETNEEAQ